MWLPSEENDHIVSSKAVGNGAGKNARISTKLKVTCQWALKGAEVKTGNAGTWGVSSLITHILSAVHTSDSCETK